MSYLRTIAVLQKEEHDPAKAVTVSLPASLVFRIDQVIHETGLGRSAVVQALIKDGLVEYLNAPLQKVVSSARDAAEHVDSMPVPSEIMASWSDEEIEICAGGMMSPSDVLEMAQARIEFNRKAVWG